MQINIVCKKKKHSISELLIAKNRRFLIGIVSGILPKKKDLLLSRGTSSATFGGAVIVSGMFIEAMFLVT